MKPSKQQRVAAGIVLLSPVLAVASCYVVTRAFASPSTYEPVALAQSPNAKHVAYLLRVDTGGGALDGFTYQVVVIHAGAVLNLRHPPDPVWTAYSLRPTKIKWLNEHHLLVEVDPREGRLNSVGTASVSGVTASTIAQ